MTEIDGHDIIVLTDAQISAMYVAASEDNAAKYYVYEDKGGNVRFGALEEIPAHLRRGKPIPLTKVQA